MVNAATVGGLLLFVEREGAKGARALAEQETQVVRDTLKLLLGDFLDRGLQTILGSPRSEADLLLGIRNDGLFDQAAFQRLVKKAVLVRLQGEGLAPVTFNIRRRYIFDEGDLDKREAFDLIQKSLRSGEVEERRNRIAGALRVGGRAWGGFYLDIGEVRAAPPTGEAVRTLFLIALPGTLFLLWFLWYFLSRGVIDPIEDLGSVARAVSRGDYSRRLPATGRRDEIGRLSVVVNRMLDLLEEYRNTMEAKVHEKTREIEAKNRELMLGQRLAATGTLAAGIAHEINNPLGGMLNAARRLRRTDVTADQKERYVALLEECIGRIGGIVQKVLALSPRKVQPTSLDLADEIRRTVELVGHRARGSGVAVELEVAGASPRVLGEANEIGQIFLNLLINGVDACRPGGRVRVRVGSDGGQAVAVVEDDGAGMPPEVAARAFDMFFTTKPAGEGTGLGLATVRALVTAHGGSLDLWTEPGTGTRFTVKLPLAHDPVQDRPARG